ncbi:MAG: flavodoxin [Deltaproteobacteria bacterium]|nr:flavodoxin [Deltaproteobacteria bacterium]
MKALNLYFSSTGNTEKVALTISDTLKELGLAIDTLRIKSTEMDIDLLQYDMVFAGSGVYAWLPGKPLMDLFASLRKAAMSGGAIQPASPKIPGKKAVIYCTYGGVHTGVNEAVPAVKYMGQLFDHLGFTIVGEWYVLGAYRPEKMKAHSVNGRMGDIRERPDSADLKDVAERVKGILRV